MYSPQISESLIPILYRLKKFHGIPMTRLVDHLIVKALKTETLPSEIQAMLDNISIKGQMV
jgi:hypothetical protein